MDYKLNPTSSVALVITVLGFTALLFRRYWRLRHIPGPFPASITNLWRAYMLRWRPMFPHFLELHQKYGPIVRIGPNTLSISDPACVPMIYSNRGYLKADSYRLMGVFLKNKSTGTMIDMQDEEQNRNMRKAIMPAFLTRNILDYEPDVDATIEDLIERITQYPTFELYQTLQFYQLDFMLKMAFSEPPAHLKQGRDVLGLARQGTPRLIHFYKWQAIPHVEAFIFRSPFWSRFIPSGQTTKWAIASADILSARKAGGKIPGRNDLLQKYIDVSEKHPDTIRPETVANLVKSTISAGGDTTAAMMATLIYFLLKDPRVYEKLLQELDQAVRDGVVSSSPRYTELSTLPYLDAVYKETLRMNAPIAAPLERIVPKGGAVLSGVHIPEGTVVGCVGQIIHLDKETYGQDSDQFRPERWLEDPQQAVLMERAWMPYGSGNRICLGKHIGELEMKRVIPALLLNFKMSLCDPSTELPLEEGMLELERVPIRVRFDRR